MERHMDGDSEAARRTRTGETLGRSGQDRPVGAEATPRIAQPRSTTGAPEPRYGEPGAVHPPEPMNPTPAGSEPSKAAAWGIIGLLILIAAIIVLPFFIFSIVIAAPIALVALVIGAFYLASRRRSLRP